MSDIGDLIQQRDELDRRIGAARQESAGAFEDNLRVLYDETYRYARRRLAQRPSLSVQESERKNVVTVTLDRCVKIAFAHDDGEHSPGLTISTTDGAEVTFSGKLPSPEVLAGLLDALLLELGR